jgi:Ca-activated chloride channel family protein
LETGNPAAVYFIAAAAVAGLLIVYEVVTTRKSMARFAASRVLPEVIMGYSHGRKLLKRVLLVAALALLIMAWAMPRVGRGMRIVKREGADIVVALDVSVSMNTEDVRPSRMEVAKGAIRSLISRLRHDRFALVGFAGSAFINCPLTLDSGALAMFVDFLNPGVISEQGTDIGAALEKSLEALRASTGRGKAIVLITDGEDHGQRLDDLIKQAQTDGVHIYALGIGTPAGEPIPIRDSGGNVTEYKRDEKDNVVVSKLDVRLLERIAQATGGRSYVLGLGDREISKLAGSLEEIEKGVLEQRSFEDYSELFQIPLVLCFILLAAESFVGDRMRNA